ncbi:MAG: riboflavin synthase, partial [Pseudomonadota bacterium]|nr:riboflavin synthase [Pseudomonadota bacterium]
MFTGIITDVGRVASVSGSGDTRFEIETVYEPDSIDMGASIACSGVCLTVIERGTRDDTHWFAVEASKETLDVT